MVKSESREQQLPQSVDTLRDMETDVITAEAEMKEQTILETTTKEVPDSGTTDHPVTTGHLEIQAVNEAVREVSSTVQPERHCQGPTLSIVTA